MVKRINKMGTWLEWSLNVPVENVATNRNPRWPSIFFYNKLGKITCVVLPNFRSQLYY